MKKIYTTPEVTVEANDLILLAASNGVNGLVDNKSEIDFGGVDETGSLDPSSNTISAWDDDDGDQL